MKIPKPQKRKSRLFRFFAGISAKLSSRYVKNCHPSFMTYINNVQNLATVSIGKDMYSKRYRQIMKILNSDKYKKYFYASVNYKRNVKPLIIQQKWYIEAFDKIVYFLSKAYVFLFEKELYKKIKYFETTSKGFIALSARVDDYIAKTTPRRRLSRMQALGIISDETFQEDFNIMYNRIPNDIVEGRREEKSKIMYLHNGESPKLPNDILKLIQTPQKPIK